MENKIPDTSGSVTTIVLNTKINEIETKILDVCGLVKRTDYNVNLSDIEGTYIITSGYRNLKKIYLIQRNSS